MITIIWRQATPSRLRSSKAAGGGRAHPSSPPPDPSRFGGPAFHRIVRPSLRYNGSIVGCGCRSRPFSTLAISATKQEAFLSGKFHRSIKPDSRFNFINVAVWDNEDVYWKAHDKSVTPMKMKLERSGVAMTPALYHVAFEY